MWPDQPAAYRAPSLHTVGHGQHEEADVDAEHRHEQRVGDQRAPRSTAGPREHGAQQEEAIAEQTAIGRATLSKDFPDVEAILPPCEAWEPWPPCPRIITIIISGHASSR
jgi:hypothetical protein